MGNLVWKTKLLNLSIWIITLISKHFKTIIYLYYPFSRGLVLYHLQQENWTLKKEKCKIHLWFPVPYAVSDILSKMNTSSSTLYILAWLLLSVIAGSNVVFSSCADWVFETCIGQEESVVHKIDKDTKTNGRSSKFHILFYCCFQDVKRKRKLKLN